MNDDCIFCQIAARKSPATIEFEDEEVIAFRDIHPKTSVHILVIPKTHISSIEDVTHQHDVLIGELIRVGRDIARKQGLSENGYRLVFNVGKEAGQAVDHVHLHVLGGQPLGNMV